MRSVGQFDDMFGFRDPQIRPLVEQDTESLQWMLRDIPPWVKNPDYDRLCNYSGVLAWKDPHVLVPALQIAEILMLQKDLHHHQAIGGGKLNPDGNSLEESKSLVSLNVGSPPSSVQIPSVSACAKAF
ncbi:hypothetical protein Q3G72_005692 [Acer saccharum]|nr:hypothetical protein Q3G72_005692 [Acer saccharum]